MKNFFLIIFFFFVVITSYAQHTERYIEITKDISRTEFKIDTTFFSNGNIKKIKGISTYDYKGGKVVIKTGEIIRFYRNGKIKEHFFTDNFGIYLKGVFYNKSGDIIHEFVTTEVDTSIDNPELFFSSESHIDYKRHYKYYTYSKKLKIHYLIEEEYVVVVNDVKTVVSKVVTQEEEGTIQGEP